MKKRLISIALILLLALTTTSFPAKAGSGRVSVTIDGVNSGRGADQIVIYSLSGNRTSTNEWGVEATVDDRGIITQVGGNNSTVPNGGFVISGHGEGKAWILQNVKVGRHARYFEKAGLLVIDDEPIPPFYSITNKFNSVNKTRFADNIVIYTGKQSSGTNEWGYEAVVDGDGTVISVGGNNNAIPSGGFVISGHGKGADLLRKIVLVGMTAEYDGSKLEFTLYFNERSLILYIDDVVNKLSEYIISAYENGTVTGYDRETAFAALNVIKSDRDEMVRKFDAAIATSDEIAAFADELEKRCSDLRADYSESQPLEYRGVWIRPTEKNSAQVRETVKKLKSLGANAVCIETQYDCCAIFPTPKDCLMVQNPSFKGFDVLESYIEECHAEGMELHCWMPVFYTGSNRSANKDISVFAKRPDLYVKNDLGLTADANGTNDFMMLDPSNPEATGFLLGLYEYLLQKYDIDGFQLDYIRYEGRGERDWGYFSNASAKFKAKYGIEPTYNTKSAHWNDWCRIRCEYVTDFVRKMRDLIDSVAPHVLLTADVFGYLSDSAVTIYQDTASWLKEGLLDAVHPMTYGVQAPANCVPSFAAICGDCILAPGIGAFMSEVDAEVMRDQIEYMRGKGIYGAITFESIGFISKASEAVISSGVYGEFAPSALRDPLGASENAVEFIKSKIGVICDAGGYTSKQKADLEKAADAALDSVRGGSVSGLNALAEALLNTGTEKAKSSFTPLAGRLKIAAKLMNTAFAKNADPLENDKVFVKEKTTLDRFNAVYGKSYEVTRGAQAAGYLFTGEKLTVTRDGVSRTITVIVPGDVDCDGEINVADYILVKRQILGRYSLTPEGIEAACVCGGEKPDVADYIAIKRHIIGNLTIKV